MADLYLALAMQSQGGETIKKTLLECMGMFSADLFFNSPRVSYPKLAMNLPSMRPLVSAALAILPWLVPELAAAADAAGNNRAVVPELAVVGDNKAVGWFVITIALALIITAFATIWVLQSKFLKTCTEKDYLELYAKLPFGVPNGTIRAMIALIIVFASLAYIALEMADIGKFPQVMAGILGTVLGFYFGSRSEAARADAGALAQVGDATRQRDRAVGQANESKLSALMKKARAGVDVARAVSKVLPREWAGKVDGIVNVAEKGLTVAGGLAGSGQVDGALEAVGKAVAVLKQDNPVKDILLRAMKSFGQVLGPAVPPLAIATVVIGIGAKLTGAAYDRWFARVLNAPYTPELFPPTVIDAACAVSIVRASPEFKQAFESEVQAGNLEFIRALVHQALSDNAATALWKREDVASRFADVQALERGLDEVQRAAMTEEVLKDVEPEQAGEFGDVGKILAAVDQLNANKEAQGDLDAMMLAMDQLKREGQPVEPVFAEAAASISPQEKK